MKKLSLLIFVLLFGFEIHAQSDPAYVKISLGTNFMGAQSDDPNFKMMGISKINRLPSLDIISRPLIIDRRDYQLFLKVGLGVGYLGHKYDYSPDTNYYMKTTGLPFFIGFGVQFPGNAYGNSHPISLSVSYVGLGPISYNNYLNHLPMFRNSLFFYDLLILHGINMHLDYRLNGDDPGVYLFTSWSYYPKKLKSVVVASMFSSYTISFGMSFTIKEGLYEHWTF